MILPIHHFLLLSLLNHLASATKQIISGATWTALGTNQHIQAHGGGPILVDGVYYWAGENKLNGDYFQSVNCYSSTDLVTWTYENALLTVQASGDLGPERVVERPHILYNEANSQYVMWMHIDDSSYGEARAGVAVSDTVCGNYTYLGASQPLGFQSRDLSVYQDTDGKGYLLTEDRENGLRIDLLSANYTAVESATFLFSSNDYEAPAIHKTSAGVYFIFGSHLSGWAPNDNQYATATSLSGPWSSWADFAPAGTDTYSSQTAAVVDINGVVVYMGDRWEESNLMTSTYVWLPLTISGTTASMTLHPSWTLSASSGTWSSAPSNTSYEATSSSNTLSGGAKILSCTECSGSEDIGYLGGTTSPGGTLTFSNLSSSVDSTDTTISIVYANGDSTQRYAAVLVNGVEHIVAFLPSGSGDDVATSVLTVPLNKGSANVIEFEGWNNTWAADIDQLIVPVS